MKKLSLCPLTTVFVYFLFTLATGVSVWKRGKRRRVNDAFVEDESVAFRACDDPKIFGCGISPEEIGIDDINIASFVQRLCDFVEEVLLHDVIVELMCSAYIECEALYFTADFTIGFVAVMKSLSSSSFVISPR